MDNIALIEGDITHFSADALVNAANPMMLGGGGVDGAIHRAAGPQLLEECRAIAARDGIRCPIGEARITGAGRLDARYVIHAVGPRYHHDPQPAALLRSTYRSSLILARNHDCRSIAFPAISCGVYGYPVDQAASIALSECGEPDYHQLAISFVLFGRETFDIWQQVYQQLRTDS